MPFLFNVYKDDEKKEYLKTIVLIGAFDLMGANTMWMVDSSLPGGKCLSPSIDQEAERFVTSSEEEAYEIMRQWWSQR